MRVNLPTSMPTTEELAPARVQLGEHLRELSIELMTCELELTDAREPLALAATLRRIAEELSVAAVTWVQLADSIRDWHV
jgi:hypothetical protein